jgi:hypothetical protein
MTNDLDLAIRRLAMQNDHPGLDGLEDSVLAQIHARQQSGPGLRAGGLAAAGAIALGILAAGPANSPAVAASPAPFGAVSALAPSTLLLADR